jgi:transposase
MQAVKTIGLDIAKSVFQVHGVDAAGNVIVRRQLKRRYVSAFFERLIPCLIGMRFFFKKRKRSDLDSIGSSATT